MDQENTDVSTILQIPADIAEFGAAFFLQQMWCWGQDIKLAEGNLFLRYGFTRERPPAGVEGSSAYFFHLDSEKRLALWGFGFLYVDTKIGGIFLRRNSFTPELMSTLSIPMNIWQVTALPSTTLPSTPIEGKKACTLFSAALLWISSYEKWIKSTLGEAYRLRCLEKRTQPIIPSQGLDTEWERLARICLNFVVDYHDESKRTLAASL